jgi:hypothetical protein
MPLVVVVVVVVVRAYFDFLTWYMSGSFSWCSTKLQRATELRSSVHSVSKGSRFTLLQKGCIDLPLQN